MATDELIVHGAREHNLKDIDVRLPRNALVCITGLSGSGKSAGSRVVSYQSSRCMSSFLPATSAHHTPWRELGNPARKPSELP